MPKFFCNFCQRQFKSPNGFGQHMKRHEAPGAFLCRHCSTRHCTKEDLTEHVRNSHAVFQCLVCKICYETIDDYVEHLEKVHEGQQGAYERVCESCGQKFRSKNALDIHLQSKCGTIKTFKCNECGLNYMSKITLAAHKLIHTGEKFFCCSYCGKRFISNGQLTVHERKHTKEKPYECEVCHKSFPYRESLITHSSLHTGIKPYICECCGSTFSCIGNLQKHRRTRPNTCGMPQYCEKMVRVAPRMSTKTTKKKIRVNKVLKKLPQINSFSENNAIEIDSIGNDSFSESVGENSMDMGNQESEKQPVEDCKRMESQKNTVETFNVEILKMENENAEYLEQVDLLMTNVASVEEPVQNEYVGIDPIDVFQDAINKSTNVASSNGQPDSSEDLKFAENVIYEIISKDGSDIIVEEYLTDEKKIEDLSEDEPGELNEKTDWKTCSTCSLEFNDSEVLIEHLAEVHEMPDEDIEQHFKLNVAPMKCPHCDKIFRWEMLYARHLKTHESENRKDKTTKSEVNASFDSKVIFVCEKCGKHFSSRFVLKDHEKSNCGANPLYNCDVCNKSYHSAGSLKTHKSIHTGSLPFLCSYCGKGFRTRGQHKVHIRKHNGEKPFKCNLCPKAFPYRQSLLTHITTHTGEKPFLCHCGQRFSCVKNLISHRNTFKTTCGTLPKMTKSIIHMSVVKGQLYVRDKSVVF